MIIHQYKTLLVQYPAVEYNYRKIMFQEKKKKKIPHPER